MDNDTAIKVSNISKSFKLPHEKQNSLKGKLINFNKKGYEIQEALRDVSFEVKKGEFFGVVGRNGSGKSTLLKLLAGIYKPDEGSIEISGKLTPFIELGVGFNFELTGRDNVFLNGALLGFNRSEMEAMYDDIVDFAELGRFMDQKLKNYSSGMQVRLAFSIAIRANTDILVLDEVLAVGDSAFQQKCFDYFTKLKEQHKTIILVTHDMSSIKRFCDRALLIKNGELIAMGTPDDIANRYMVENIQTGSETGDEANKLTSGPISRLEVNAPNKQKFTSDSVYEFTVDYELNEDVEIYLGLSVIYEGMSILEENSRKIHLPSTPDILHSVKYQLPLSVFNSVPLSINVSIFDFESRGTLGFVTEACKLFVEAQTGPTMGGPIASPGGWERV